MWDSIQDRSSGQIDLLIGANGLGLHPSDYESQGNMRIKQSIFGKGLILTGSHPDIYSPKIIWNEDVHHIRQCYFASSDVTVNRISVKPFYD